MKPSARLLRPRHLLSLPLARFHLQNLQCGPIKLGEPLSCGLLIHSTLHLGLV